MKAATQKRVIALGFFDGVHLGHRALLAKTVEVARTLDAIPAACTFDVHPATLISHRRVELLTTPADRSALMGDYGIRQVIIAPFNEAMMTMPWDRFVTDFLVRDHRACHLVVGQDHRFGYRGEGTALKLKDLCASLGLGCDIIPEVELEGETVSSTLIRGLVRAGDVERANRFLGHPYFVTAPVVHGKGLGGKLGFPTVNLAWPEEVGLPAYGVYAAKAWVLPAGPGDRIPGSGPFAAVTNVGVRPTVDDSGKVSVETFLLDFDGDLYGRTLRLELHRRLRPERAFGSVEELCRAVAGNIEEARRYFETT